MNLGIFSSLCSLMNLQDSSIFTRLICASYGTNSWINNLGNFIFGLIYNVIKYVLYFMDLLFSYIQKLAGLDMSFNSIEEMITPESDIVFNFLISNKDMITTILKNLLVLVLVLIIVFTIASIIKSQYDAVKNDSEASPVEAIKSMIKAFVLLLVTPLIFIGGIIMSDLVLQTFYRATNINGAASLGTQVFLSSSTSANAYRIYAQNGQRIPIVFDDSKNSEISEYFNENSINDGFVKYLKDSKNYGVDYDFYDL